MTQPGKVLVIAARRTVVSPRGGALKDLQADELVAPLIGAALSDAGVCAEKVDHVILGNALYGGGNPARLAALRAGLPAGTPAFTLDSQCCSGLDAVLMAARLIEAGDADIVVAGGTESFSRAPIRMHRPVSEDDKPVEYSRPPFSPWVESDPDMEDAIAVLAHRLNLTREAQALFAVASHQKAMNAIACGRLRHEISRHPKTRLQTDAFSRNLSLRTALRAPVLAGHAETGPAVSTVAVEADAAAVLILMRAECFGVSSMATGNGYALLFRHGVSVGGDPAEPALAATKAMQCLFDRFGLKPSDMDQVELMEAYAAQALATAGSLGLEEGTLNPDGGALARGHPIGASGAILAVRLFHGLRLRESGSLGIAGIAAAGGLGTSILFEAVHLPSISGSSLGSRP